ncbi:uncharacterized protein LOC143223861 [Tachypleus tridentatus]|uniref:uncharacterized protein LOC143223861 n=1 Tax=Tachypleus tridentatus TaxID=6853 RepID=UPI003FD58F94
MNVHLFGTVSSLACTRSGLRQEAYDITVESPQAACFIQEGFYVDDGLKSVKTVSKAIHFIKETQRICAKGNIHLHNLLSNKQLVLDAISLIGRASKMENFDLPEKGTLLERVLGIQ